MKDGASSKGVAGKVTFSDPIDDSKKASSKKKNGKPKELIKLAKNDGNKVDPDVNENNAVRSDEESDAPKLSGYLYWLNVIIPIVTHGIAIWVYFAPIYYAEVQEKVLDEIHILSDNFADVRGTSPWTDVFKNDYWGRPMTKIDSHKSWRPFSILLLRWLNLDGVDTTLDRIFVHRMIGVIIHASLAESVSVVGCQLFPDANPVSSLILRTITKLIFALHPCHVEAVVNSANRPHILALLVSMIAVDCRTHIVFLYAAYVIGLTSAETFIFQMPAIILTMLAIQWNMTTERNLSSLRSSLIPLLPRIFVVCGLTSVYLFGRYYYDTLQINPELIRKAENAFAHYEGKRRLLSFPLVVAIHIGKMFTIDPIGSSHEYGFDCVRGVESEDDFRLIYPAGIALTLLVTAIVCLKRGTGATLMFLVFAAWLATLFPICGFITVGTFIADRLTIASSFGFCVFAGKALTMLFCHFHERKNNEALITSALFCLMWMSNLYGRVSKRAVEWTGNLSLLQSSLDTCPRSAKSNLEMSKIYSGLYPEKTNITHALLLISRAEEIDPDFCDVHWQFAQIMFQNLQKGFFFSHPDDPRNLDRFEEFEDRLTSSVMCSHSANSAITLFQTYWKLLTKDSNRAKLRYERQLQRIQDKIGIKQNQAQVEPKQKQAHVEPKQNQAQVEPIGRAEQVDDTDTGAENGICEDPTTCDVNNSGAKAADAGVPQKVGGTEGEKQKTNAVIEKSLQYRKAIISANPQLAADCVNTNELCAFWASLGECENNPGFMTKGCKLACQVCPQE